MDPNKGPSHPSQPRVKECEMYRENYMNSMDQYLIVKTKRKLCGPVITVTY